MRRPLLLLAAAAALLAGCAIGAPAPAPPASTPPPIPALPDRPRDLPLDGLDPCAGLTADQLRQLDIFRPRFTSDEGIGDTCQWRHGPDEPKEGYLLAYGLDIGIEAAFGNPKTGDVIDIAGYPAVETQGQIAPRDTTCIVVVDVAPGQALTVQYAYDGHTLPMTYPLACDRARTAAELATRTLLDRPGG